MNSDVPDTIAYLDGSFAKGFKVHDSLSLDPATATY